VDASHRNLVKKARAPRGVRIERRSVCCRVCGGRAVRESWITNSYTYVEFTCGRDGGTTSNWGFRQRDLSAHVRPIVIDGKLRWRRFDSDDIDLLTESSTYVDYNTFGQAKKPTSTEVRAVAAILALKTEPHVVLLRKPSLRQER